MPGKEHAPQSGGLAPHETSSFYKSLWAAAPRNSDPAQRRALAYLQFVSGGGTRW